MSFGLKREKKLLPVAVRTVPRRPKNYIPLGYLKCPLSELFASGRSLGMARVAKALAKTFICQVLWMLHQPAFMMNVGCGLMLAILTYRPLNQEIPTELLEACRIPEPLGRVPLSWRFG